MWRNLIQASGLGAALEHLDTAALARSPMNGRAIKNSLRLALALQAADERAGGAQGAAGLSQGVLQEALASMGEFQAEMDGAECWDEFSNQPTSGMGQRA